MTISAPTLATVVAGRTGYRVDLGPGVLPTAAITKPVDTPYRFAASRPRVFKSKLWQRPDLGEAIRPAIPLRTRQQQTTWKRDDSRTLARRCHPSPPMFAMTDGLASRTGDMASLVGALLFGWLLPSSAAG